MMSRTLSSEASGRLVGSAETAVGEVRLLGATQDETAQCHKAAVDGGDYLD